MTLSASLRAANFELGGKPTTKEAQTVADQLYAEFVSQESDKVELIYSKFVSLISTDQTVQTLLPLTPQARIIYNFENILQFRSLKTL